MDKYTQDVRSRMMSAVRSKNNRSTEQKLIRLFRSLAIKGWRRSSRLHGKPDFIFPKSRVALFADGCFWHGHNCRPFNPSSNAEYWSAKIKRNRSRDRVVNRILKAQGWTVIRVWECQINEKMVLRKLRLFLEE